jgi:hypothetical protein
METMKGYRGLNTFKILAEKDFGVDNKYYLVDCGNDFYGYGTIQDLQSISFVSVDRCGTKEKVRAHCKLIANMCEENIKKYKEMTTSINENGLELLIAHEQDEFNMLTEFARVLTV